MTSNRLQSLELLILKVNHEMFLQETMMTVFHIRWDPRGGATAVVLSKSPHAGFVFLVQMRRRLDLLVCYNLEVLQTHLGKADCKRQKIVQYTVRIVSEDHLICLSFDQGKLIKFCIYIIIFIKLYTLAVVLLNTNDLYHLSNTRMYRT